MNQIQDDFIKIKLLIVNIETSLSHISQFISRFKNFNIFLFNFIFIKRRKCISIFSLNYSLIMISTMRRTQDR